MHTIKQSLTIIVPLLFLISIIGCGKKSTTNSLAAFQPEIVNNADSFSFQATGVVNTSTTVTYTWANSGAQATINHSSVVSAGSAIVTILDANSNQVYTNALVASVNEPTSSGITGNWTITVTLTNCSGTLNFRAEKL